MIFKTNNVNGIRVYESVNASQPVIIFKDKDGEWDGVFTFMGEDVFPRTFKKFIDAVRYATLEVGLDK